MSLLISTVYIVAMFSVIVAYPELRKSWPNKPLTKKMEAIFRGVPCILFGYPTVETTLSVLSDWGLPTLVVILAIACIVSVFAQWYVVRRLPSKL